MTGKEVFIQMIMERFNKTSEEAQRITDVFIKLKAAKYDGVGQLRVVHGAFLEPEVIERALEHNCEGR